MTAQAQTTLNFSVDMATNLANGSFNPPPPAGTGTDVIDVRGAFNGWAPLPLVQQGTSMVWTNTTIDNANGVTFDYKFYLNGNGETTACYDNRTAMLPATPGATLTLPTHYYSDIGPGITINVKFQIDMSEEIELGNFHPLSGDKVVVAGSFDGWSTAPGAQFTLTNDPTILVTNNNFSPAVVESNVYVITAPITQCSAYAGLPATNASQDFKYVEMPSGSWESSSAADSNDNGNRWFTETGDQTLPLVSFSDAPYAPLAKVTLNLDMSGIALYDTNYVPNSVTAWGSFNGWANGVTLTNNPAAPNTNLFSATVNMGEGASFVLQYRYTNSFIAGWVYDYAQDGGPNSANNNDYRRMINLPVTPTFLVTNFPPVFFNDLAPDDCLPAAMSVFFSVDMNGAVGTEGYPFNPATDGVFINGMFAGGSPSQPTGGISQSWYAWSSGSNPYYAPPGFQMIEAGSTTVYTNTIVLPAGTPVALSYQYGINPNNFYGGPLEDEAPANNVHYRAVRSTQSNPYIMPVDTFTNQPHVEPFFSTGNIGANGNLGGGNLTVGTPVSGMVPVSWLGRPGAHLQINSSLTNPVWQNISATDGTTWTTGFSSANGFVSVTNWPASGNTFFRVVKP
jgi:hypothetical protein